MQIPFGLNILSTGVIIREECIFLSSPCLTLTLTFTDSRPHSASSGRFKFRFQSQIAMYQTKSLYLNDRKQTAKVHVVVFQAAVNRSSAVK